MSENLLHVTDESFAESVLSVQNKPVFVDFWAPWCGPCRMLAPAYETAAKEFSDEAVFTKYNVDENNAVAMENSIRGIPTILVYKNGAVVGQHVGLMSKSELTAFIDQYID